MASSVTASTALNLYPINGGLYQVTPTKVVINGDTNPHNVIQPASTHMVGVVGLVMCGTNAATITLDSYNNGGSSVTYSIDLNLAAKQPVITPIGQGIIFCTEPGDYLRVTSTADINILFYTVEDKYFDLRPGGN